MDHAETKDFTDLTCTNLMIKLKIILNKLPKDEPVVFFATREQVDNTCSQFARQGYDVQWDGSGDNRFLVTMRK